MSEMFSNFPKAVPSESLWDESVQQHAPKFLNQSIGPDTPLSDVVAALVFLERRGVRCQELRLKDVLHSAIGGGGGTPKLVKRRRTPRDSDQKTAPVPAPVAEAPSDSNLSSRLSEDIERLKTLVVRKLVGTLEPLTTDDLLKMLRSAGDILPLHELEDLLGTLQNEGRITHHPQNARAWMFRVQSQSVVIRKAEAKVSS